MAGKPRPKPSFLDGFHVVKVVGRKKVWFDPVKNRYMTWDSLHGEIEVFNHKGRHLGALDAVSGEFIKDAVKGRMLEL